MIYFLSITAFGLLVLCVALWILYSRAAADACCAQAAADKARRQAEAAGTIGERWRADALTLRARHGYNTDLGVMP